METELSGVSHGNWKSSLLRSIRRIAIALTAVFAVAIAVLWVVQERLVFVPPPTPAQQGHGATRIEFTSSDGQQLFGFLVPAPSAKPPETPERLVLHFHGNGDLADSWIDWAREVAEHTDWSVFLAEYRGYGGLPGNPTYDGLMQDARAALALLQTRYGIPQTEIVLYGHSLGTGVATQLAVEKDVRAVLLEAPITSVVDIGRRNFGPPLSWVLPLISRIDFSPVDRVRRIEAPVWVVSGGSDDVVPAWMGRSVFDAALRRGKFLLVPHAGHGNVSDVGDDRYWQWLRQALGG